MPIKSFGEAVFRLEQFRGFQRKNEFNVFDMHWTQYESPLTAYQFHFRKVEPNIVGFLKERRLRGKVYVFDALGAGRAVRDLAIAGVIDGGLSLTLNDFRNKSLQSEDAFLGVDVMAANIMYGSTISKVRDWIRQQNTTTGTFDMILCDPGLGFAQLRMYPFHWALFETFFWRSVSLLNPNGGVLLSDIPSFMNGDVQLVEKWIKLVNNEQVGVSISYDTARLTGENAVLRAERQPTDMLRFNPSLPSHYKKISKSLY